jgi:hypothetical protein
MTSKLIVSDIYLRQVIVSDIYQGQVIFCLIFTEDK